jgi:hypothetical protein
MDAEERGRKIEEYGRGYDVLATALAAIPRQAWSFKASAQDWSVHEIIVHVGDSESMAALRIRKLIVEPGSTIMAYEESRWAAALKYQDQNADDSLLVIKLARQTTYRLLKFLPAAVFSQSVTHPDYQEPYTFDTWLGIYARHIPDHVEQMKKAYEAWKKK